MAVRDDPVDVTTGSFIMARFSHHNMVSAATHQRSLASRPVASHWGLRRWSETVLFRITDSPGQSRCFTFDEYLVAHIGARRTHLAEAARAVAGSFDHDWGCAHSRETLGSVRSEQPKLL
jgi:hypothetical protein